MSGLDKILAEIRDEAAAEAKMAVDAAKGEAEKILTKAKEDSSAQMDRILAAANAEVADVERSRESAIALQHRQRTLAQKQTLLCETLQKAQTVVKELPDDLYFGLLARLAKNAAQNGQGVMFLNQKDKDRMPADFEKKLGAELMEGASLSVSGTVCQIDGGFVLKYGDVEENCSIEAIFNARGDEFSDLIRQTLFG